PIYSVDASYMLDDNIGYIKVNRFGKTTMQELREGLVKMKNQGMKDLVLDLQGNGGGYLQTAIEMADEFLSEQKLIVFTQGRAFPKDDFYAKREGLFEKGRLVVLIDEGSASASEIVSGAIQDWDRGLIIGRRSFGKGLVQRPVPLPDGSEVRLTVQKYYTPSGRCIQKPYDDGVEAYRNEKYDRYDSGELYSIDGVEFPDSLKYATNLKSRTVYGGGGILPDLFVPLDTTMSSSYFTDLIRTGAFNQFVLEYSNQNRERLMKKYSSADQFISEFAVDDEFEQALIDYAQSEDVDFNQEEFDTSHKAIEIRLKALLGRNLYDSGVFYQVINELNSSLQRAVMSLKDGTFEKANLAYKDF
ncbi:MAG: S41 family peptidase, partial [Flavobacteriales bacterium]